MSYPLVIFGAGASYGYLDGHESPVKIKLRPPLANELFSVRFESTIHQYKEISDLASNVRSMLSNTKNLENCLTSIYDKADKNSNRKRQLIASRYYLHDIFRKVTEDYQPSNNYAALTQLIEDHCDGKACFINFNYDLLLEKTIDEKRFINVESYIENTAKMRVIKIHGASDWFYTIKNIIPTGAKTSYEESIAIAGTHIENYRNNEEQHAITVRKFGNGKRIPLNQNGKIEKISYLPAIAIPLQKKDNYVCPESHIKFLKRSINQFDRIIIIGWQAADSFLVKFLEEGISENVPIVIVTGKKSMDDVLGNLGEKLQKQVLRDYSFAGERGFLEFIKSGRCEKFLEENSFETGLASNQLLSTRI